LWPINDQLSGDLRTSVFLFANHSALSVSTGPGSVLAARGEICYDEQNIPTARDSYYPSANHRGCVGVRLQLDLRYWSIGPTGETARHNRQFCKQVSKSE
jgi:hypothetical protein